MVMRLDQLLGPLRGFPKLRGARCLNRWDLFDPPSRGMDPEDVEYREQAALRLCRECPALADCAEWYIGLRPSQRPEGVVAGKVRRNRNRVAA